jgi:hypothetical protein
MVCLSVVWIAVHISTVPHLLDDEGSADGFRGKPWPTFTDEDYYPAAMALLDAHQWDVVSVTSSDYLAESARGNKSILVEGNPFAPGAALIAARVADMLVACVSLPLGLFVLAAAMGWVVKGFRQR